MSNMMLQKHGADGDAEDAPSSKRMRKGTKSCAECRRRKIKCNYDVKPDICDNCAEKGLECIEQANRPASPKAPKSQNTQHLQGRLNQLEGLVKTLLVKLDDKGTSKGDIPNEFKDINIVEEQLRPDLLPATPVSLPDQTSHVKTNSVTQNLGNKPDLGPNPYLSLFQNDFVEAQGDWVEPATTAIAQDVPGGEISFDPSRIQRLKQQLIAYFPSQHAIRILTRDFGQWFIDWTNNLPDIFDAKFQTLDDVVQDALIRGSPVALAQSLLALAMCMQQIPTSYDATPLQFAAAPYELADIFAREVYRLVLGDDDLAGTFEGIVCLIVYSKFCTVAGRPRRSWLAHRRAVTFAQLLNLHRRPNRAVDSPGFNSSRKEQTWANLYIIDHIMSLVFGQPYTICAFHCDIDTSEYSNLGFETSFMVRLSQICGRISDRNHHMMESTPNKLLSVTFEIDQELEELVQSSPQLFSNTEAKGLAARLLLRFLYFHIRVLLHLPLMIRSASDTRFHHGKVAAVDAAREMIRCFADLRSTKSGDTGCNKVVDFEAFTAAMLLILNILGYSRDITQGHESDWNLVKVIIDLLRSSVNGTGGKVSEQCLRTLELFYACRTGGCDDNGQQNGKVVIPFYGTLILGPNKTSKAGAAAMAARNTESQNMGASQLPTPSMTDSTATSPNMTTPDPTPLTAFPNGPGAFSFDLNQGMFPYSTMGMGQQQPAMDGDGMDGSWNFMPQYNTDLDHDWSWSLGGEAQT
ncbi:uncharacterized protein KY384_005089 [Bacidia gigantensis]|uniref:uncharacterized protein n=1 Tax=Bacidia gigantensis TaxID=2732470 RepID=UPI001D053B8B|nr:uncharacterized protein KY384_005089 [Bacidia gigantensis]KAG8530586.1 hypothetical protein KY384_005089 [Bacidia gigantensis]